jgi:hypothetical protein
VPLPVTTGLILVTSRCSARPPGAEGRAGAIFQLSWGVPIALTWSILALTCASAVPALLVLRKQLPHALREPSPPVAA